MRVLAYRLEIAASLEDSLLAVDGAPGLQTPDAETP